MIQRGRRSNAALQLVGPGMGQVSVVQRPKPPAGMPESQCVYWRVVVDSMPADWFRPEQLPLLVQYCRHNVAADRIALMIEEGERRMLSSEPADFDLDIVSLDRLLKMQERESRAIATLATKMRLSQQSTYDKSKRKPLMGKKPWQVESE
jgi:hypothetical protein